MYACIKMTHCQLSGPGGAGRFDLIKFLLANSKRVVTINTQLIGNRIQWYFFPDLYPWQLIGYLGKMFEAIFEEEYGIINYLRPRYTGWKLFGCGNSVN